MTLEPGSVQPIIALSLNLLFGLFVILRNPRSTNARVFFFLALTFVLWQVGSALQRSTVDGPALLWQRVQYVGVVMIPVAFTLFSREFLKNNANHLDYKPLHAVIYAGCLIFLLSIPLGLLITTETVSDEYGIMGQTYETVRGGYGPMYPFFVVFFISIFLISMSAYLRAHRMERSQNRRRAIRLVLSSALVVGAIGSLTDIILPLFGINYPMADFLTIVVIGTMAVAMVKYKIFAIPRPTHDGTMVIPDDVEWGRILLVPVHEGGEHLDAFNKMFEKGSTGIVYTNRSPSEVRELLGNEKVPVLMVTDRDVEEEHLNLDQDTEILESLGQFLRRSKRTIIFILLRKGSIGDMLRNHDRVWRILGMLKRIEELVRDNDGLLMIPLRKDRERDRLPENTISIDEGCWWMLQSFLKAIQRHALVHPHMASLEARERFVMMGHLERISGEELQIRKVDGEWVLQGPTPTDRKDILAVMRALAISFNLIEREDLTEVVFKQGKRIGVKENEILLHPGGAYLLLDGDRGRGFRILNDLAHDKHCLIVTKNSPDMIMRKNPIPNTCEILWPSKGKDLSEGDIGHKVRSVGTGLEHIHREMKEFKAREDCHVVLLEAFEYLVSQNGFDSVFRFVERIVDDITTSDSIFLMPVDPDFMEPGQVALLTKIMEKI